jgi:hypothetical protein
VPGEVQAACERSGESGPRGCGGRISAVPAGDEPSDLHDRRLGAGTGPLGSGPPGPALRGISMVGGPAEPRRRATGWQSTSPRRKPRDTAPTRASGAPESLREEDEGKIAQPEPCDLLVSTPREEPSSSPRAPRPCPTARGLGRSSRFFRYRSHSSFVDGRDACLVIVCLPAGADQRDPRHASAPSAAADPLVAQQGHMKRRRIREDGPVGLVQIRSCPRITEQKVESPPARTSGPSCTWSKRRSRP